MPRDTHGRLPIDKLEERKAEYLGGIVRVHDPEGTMVAQLRDVQLAGPLLVIDLIPAPESAHVAEPAEAARLRAHRVWSCPVAYVGDITENDEGILIEANDPYAPVLLQPDPAKRG